MEGIINSTPVKNTVKNLFGDKEVEIVERPASYIIKQKNESEDKVTRVILLPPRGFTSNEISQTSPHPEVRRAKITIKGGIRQNRQRFSILNNVIKYAHYTKRDIEIEESCPYVVIDKNSLFYKEEIKSSRETFFVVKENGKGFFHNIINISKEWILLILVKELRLQKNMNVQSKIKNLSKEEQKTITDLIEEIKRIGDCVFEKRKELINKILSLNLDEAVPPLIEALNIYEAGKHEPCTIYAIILKFGKKNPAKTIELLKNSIKNDEAPRYYLNELINKLSNHVPWTFSLILFLVTIFRI